MTARIRSLAALILAGTALAGCGADHGPGFNPSLYSVHQPVVQRSDLALDLGTSGGRVPQGELERLAAWFDSLQIGYGDRIFVDEPQGYGAPGARQDVAALAGRRGLMVAEGAPLTNGSVQPGSVRVIVSRMRASVPDCPAGRAVDTGQHTTTSAGFGCGVNSNLAAMIADPNDLVLGQTGSTQSDPARAIRTYRDTPQTGTRGLTETTTGGGGNR
jgi:pilus assembly protein CpaD